MSYTNRIVDGIAVPLTAGEIAELEARDTADAPIAADRAVLAQIAALEALQTPRLLREAMKKKACVVNKPGTIIHELAPEDAIDAIDTALDALRAQLTGGMYYQVG